MTKFVTRFIKNESGATAIEYGLIAALISVVIIGILTTVGTSLNTKFTAVNFVFRLVPTVVRMPMMTTEMRAAIPRADARTAAAITL